MNRNKKKRRRIGAGEREKGRENQGEKTEERARRSASSRAPSAHPHLNEINLVTCNFHPAVGSGPAKKRDGKAF